MINRVETIIAGRTLSLENGLLAPQAEGSVTVRYGDTIVLTTVVTADKPTTADYFPMSVEFAEKYYSAGKIKGSRFVKREGRPSDWAILSGRITDRTLRPLFPKEARNDVQVVSTILSIDFENEPETLSVIGGSAALGLTGAPFEGPVSAVKVGFVDGQLILNPTVTQLESSTLDLLVSGTSDAIVMVEAGAQEVDEAIMVQALGLAHEEIKKICELQKQFLANFTVAPKAFTCRDVSDETMKMLQDKYSATVLERLNTTIFDGQYPDLKVKHLFNDLQKGLKELVTETTSQVELEQGFFLFVREQIRRNILDKAQRPDKRQLTQVRPIASSVGLIPRTHGSALFTRGGTQALTLTTLGSASDEQIVDGANTDEEFKKRYIHHYNAPPFSVGETGRMMGPKRREIGHGALAERALEPMLPTKDEFPYTMLVVSEVLSQNGSSSMASVCGSTLSLMDAGVPIKRPVAGIAMGLVWESIEKHAILSDIQGMEDFCGDMDFKVAGTEVGITAIQMDIKIKGLSLEVLTKALAQAKEGRMHILGEMAKTMTAPRANLSPYAPKITSIRINPEKIRDVIGSGGKIINKIIADTKTKIDIEDDGLVMVSSTNQDDVNRAIKIIQDLTADVEVGKIYHGTVVKILDFGAFVEILPGKDGLCHISQLAPFRVNKVEDVVKMGDEIDVKVMEIDSMGRYNLSKKAADAQMAQAAGQTKTEETK